MGLVVFFVKLDKKHPYNVILTILLLECSSGNFAFPVIV